MAARPWVLIGTFVLGLALGGIGVRALSVPRVTGGPSARAAVLVDTALGDPTGERAALVDESLGPGVFVGRHYHNGHELVYVLEGAVTFDVEGRGPVSVTAGQAVYIPPKAVHTDRNDSRVARVRMVTCWIREPHVTPSVWVKEP